MVEIQLTSIVLKFKIPVKHKINGNRNFQFNYVILLNDTHRERLMFHSILYRNGWLAASDLFDMFTQSIKFQAFHYQYLCIPFYAFYASVHLCIPLSCILCIPLSVQMFEKCDSSKKWMVAPFSKFYGKIWVSFCLNTGKHFFLEVLFSSQQKEHRFF